MRAAWRISSLIPPRNCIGATDHAKTRRRRQPRRGEATQLATRVCWIADPPRVTRLSNADSRVRMGGRRSDRSALFVPPGPPSCAVRIGRRRDHQNARQPARRGRCWHRTRSAMAQIAIPTPDTRDSEDVHWALSTAASLWASGAWQDAVRWLRRAAETANDREDDDRALELFKAAAAI